MRWFFATLLAAMLATPAHAAEVSGLGAGGREIYLRLEAGERLAVGDALQVGGKNGQRLQVVEVIGRRARLESAQPVSLRIKDQVKIQTVAQPEPAPPAVEPGHAWKVAPALPPGRAEQLAQQAQTWQAVTRQRQPWVDDIHILGREPEARISGHLTLVAVGLLDRRSDQSWGLMRLSNRLDVEGLFGTPVSWHHDLSAWMDSLGGVPADSQRRMWQVRQAELALATSPSRVLGGSIGRGYAPEGAGAGAIDGSTLRVRLDESIELLAFGGFLPSIASTAFDAQAYRFGAAAQAQGEIGGWRSWSRASWSLARQGAAWDRQLMGLVARGEHARFGEVQGEIELAAGGIDLAGTTWAHSGAQDSGVRPVRGLFQWVAPPLRGWVPRVRYSYYRAEMTRELAWTLPLAAWSASQYHQLYGTLDTPRLGRLDLQAAGWGSKTDSADPWESWRWGASLRAGLPAWPTPAWNWSATFAGQSGTTLTGGSVALAGDWSVAQALRWHARVRYSHDRVETSAVSSDAIDARVGFDWGRSPWIVGLTVGGRSTLATDAAVMPDWLDATLIVSRRL